MKIVLDNNILFSIINPFSVTSYLFSSINAEFFAPEFIKQELKNHKEECLIKSKLSEEQFEMRQTEIEREIKFFKINEYENFLEKAKDLISDPNDIDFLSLALAINSVIWSNDCHLKEQFLIKVYSTKDLLEMFLKRKI